MTQQILITAKISPDLDGFACAYAYSRLLSAQGVNVVGGVFGKAHVEAQYLIDRFGIEDVDYNPDADFASFILVDASDILGMPSVIRNSDVIEVIDYREYHRANELFPNAKLQIEKLGSAATQITEKYMESDVLIDKNSAILLYCAIYSNTLNFKSPLTSPRDEEAARWIEGQVELPENLISDLFHSKTEEAKRKIRSVLMSDFKTFTFDSKLLGVTQLEVINLQTLFDECATDIFRTLDELVKENSLDYVFLTAVDLEESFNLFVSNNTETQALLSEIFEVQFIDGVAKKAGLLLRKQLLPLIAAKLSSSS